MKQEKAVLGMLEAWGGPKPDAEHIVSFFALDTAWTSLNRKADRG